MTPPPGAGGGPVAEVDPEELVTAAAAQLAVVTTVTALDELRSDLLGKRSALARAHQGLAALAPEDRPEAGRPCTRRARRSSRTWPRNAVSSSTASGRTGCNATDWI